MPTFPTAQPYQCSTQEEVERVPDMVIKRSGLKSAFRITRCLAVEEESTGGFAGITTLLLKPHPVRNCFVI